MMDLNEILVFATVVRTGSFTAAARKLDMPKSTVSRKVSELEARLGARLLQRTTRRLSLTDAGRTYHRHAERVVAELEAAELAITRMQEAPRGLLRVTTPLNFAYLGPIVAAFLERNPEVQIELVCADRVVDLVEEGFDLAVRAGPLADSSLIARHLGTFESLLVAAPRFLAAHGEPQAPRDLEPLDALAFGAGPDRASWKLRRGSETVTVRFEPRLVVNDFDFLVDAAVEGLGITMLPIFRCTELLRRKELRRVLPEWCSAGVPIHAVYPSTRHLAPKVVAFLDHLREQMSPPPWARDPPPDPRRRTPRGRGRPRTR